MNHYMEKEKVLKCWVIFGGIVEILLGPMFLFLDSSMKLMSIMTFPLFNQVAGAFVLCYGILLLWAALEMENRAIIPFLNVVIRIIVVSFSIAGISTTPESFMILLIPAMIFDVLWALFTIILLFKCGYLSKNIIK